MTGIRLYQTFAEVTEHRRLAPARNFYSSDVWLRLLEDHGHQHRYVLLSDGPEATALAPLTAGPAARNRRYHPDYLLSGRFPAARCALVGPNSGHHNELRVGVPAPPAPRLADGLLDGTDYSVALVPYLPSGDAADFEAAGHPAGLVACEAWLDVPRTGFDGYLASLSRSGRNQAKGDLRRVGNAGMVFDARPLAAPFDDLAELLVAHERKYDPAYHQPSSRFARYLARCAEIPGAYAIVARLEGRIVGCHIVFCYNDVLWVRLLGVDELDQRTRGCYFSLMFYEPVKLAHRLGARKVHLGIGAYEAKIRRGARLEPLWTVALTRRGADRDRARDGLRARREDSLATLPADRSPATWVR
jgi:hypothetical protein